MYLITRWFGVFLCDNKGVYKKIVFKKDEKEITKKLKKIESNELLSEEKKISKGKKVIVNEKRLQTLGEFKPDDPFFKQIKIEYQDHGFSIKLLQRASKIVIIERITEKLQSEDLQIIQMVNGLDDLIQTSNLLSERISCWNDIPSPEKKVQPIKTSLFTVKKEMTSLEKQIELDMKNVAPNISQIIGPLIGARLISLAGGIEQLAILPASTIQILGAEKALFRFKKEGGKPPKHGVIFQYSYINKAPRNVRGKIARAVATKVSIAAKADAFTRRNISDDLERDLKERIQEIKNL